MSDVNITPFTKTKRTPMKKLNDEEPSGLLLDQSVHVNKKPKASTPVEKTKVKKSSNSF
jgi:hypothetical protein